MEEMVELHQELRERCLFFRKKVKQATKKLAKQEEESAQSAQWEHFRQLADTILVYRDQIPKGERLVQLSNPHTGEMESIVLNPRCSPDKNAELFYKKARKGERSFERCRQNCQETQEEIIRTQEFLAQAESYCKDGEAIGNATEIQKFLRDHPLGKVSASAKTTLTPSPFRHYSYQGWDIYAGRNSRENDALSTRFARPSDIWFHAVGYAGSHLIIRRANSAPWPPQDILELVGGMAVFLSKAKHCTHAEVHITEARYVRKPRKSPPGEVVAERCKTLRVRPLNPQTLFKDNICKK